VYSFSYTPTTLGVKVEEKPYLGVREQKKVEYRRYIGLQNWKSVQRPTEGCRAIDELINRCIKWFLSLKLS
jgi:hypothetical protein